MKYSMLFSLLILLGSFSANTQSVAPITLVTSISLSGAEQVNFYPAGKVDIEYWNHNHAKVEIEISETTFTRSQLKALIPLGTYRLKTDTNGTMATIEMPGLEKYILMGDKSFDPELSFKLFLPHYTKFVRPNHNNNALAEAN